MEYKNRIADQLLRDKLEAMGAVLIEGPKACGKTTTAEQQAKSIIYMDDPTKQQQYKQMAQTNISFLLEGETPRLIDEWQEQPEIWNYVRHEVDDRNPAGDFDPDLVRLGEVRLCRRALFPHHQSLRQYRPAHAAHAAQFLRRT